MRCFKFVLNFHFMPIYFTDTTQRTHSFCQALTNEYLKNVIEVVVRRKTNGKQLAQNLYQQQQRVECCLPKLFTRKDFVNRCIYHVLRPVVVEWDADSNVLLVYYYDNNFNVIKVRVTYRRRQQNPLDRH